MDNPRTTLCLSGPFKSFTATPHEVAYHVANCARPAPSRPGPLRDSTEDRRIGLNMNYSIIFKEISFSPETSILLQIIQIIHMTIGIMPESDRKREGSLSDESHPGDLLTYPPPFWGRKETTRFPKKNSLKRTHKRF